MKGLRRRPVATSGLLAMVVVLVLAPIILGPTNTNLLVLVCINVLAAVGLSLLFGYAGQISLAQAQLMGLGAYTSAILTTRVGFPVWLAIVAAAVVPGVVAYAVGRPILRLRGYYLAMATVAIGGILAVLFQQLTSVTGGFNGIVGIPSPSIGPLSLNQPETFYYLALVLAALAVLFAWNLTRSRMGRAMRAIRESETGAAVMGVNVPALKTVIFVMSAVMAGLAGSLYAHYTLFISPETFSISQSVTFVLILSIGGMGSLGGAVVGAILLTLLPQWLRAFGAYDNLIYGVLVVVVIMFLPGGIWGGLQGLRGPLAQLMDRRDRARVPKEAVKA